MKRFLLGLVVTLMLVLGSSLLTWRTGLSYSHFTWAAYGVNIMYPEHEDDDPGGCNDGEDNDNDGLVDCADVADCGGSIVCRQPAPIVSAGGMAALMGTLLLIGLYGLMRRRAEHS